MRKIDPYSVRLFVAVARAGSIVRAAEAEHIAASALSRRLADLEHAFGTALLVRSPKGVSLTDAGHVVLRRGERIEAEMQDLLREIEADVGGLQGIVRVHANMSAVIGFLPERLHAFMAAHPGVTVRLHEHDTRDVVRACLDDRADVGIGVSVALPPGLEARDFALDPLQVVVPVDHLLAGCNAISYKQVLGYPLVGVHEGGALDRLLIEQARALGARFEPTVSVSSFDAVCRMVEAGLGIAVIPRSAAAAFAGSSRFRWLPLDEAWADRMLQIYVLRKSPLPRVVGALLRHLSG